METPEAKSGLQAALRNLPAVDHLLRQPVIDELADDYPRSEILRVVRAVLEQRRAQLRAGQAVAVDTPSLALDIRQQLYARSRPCLRRVINATGIVLHTGLGRAPLPPQAIDAIVETAGGYCNLELDLETGQRGSRHDHLRGLLRELCGVEDALVVNNNAAATFLALNTFAAGREVLISRGQLVEIGGSYRLPDIMAAAQCRMVEVGTTNRTRIADYERALTENTGVIIRVHCSNYRIEGFTESASLAQLVELGQRNHVIVVDDLGSGLMTDELPWPNDEPAGAEQSDDHGAAADSTSPAPTTWDEPTICQSVSGGADVTLFSGDKLLGGPQAGILIGRSDLITALRKNPLARAFRPGKLTLAALEATLRLYRDSEDVVRRIPAYRLLARTQDSLAAAARELGQRLADAVPEAQVSVVADWSEAGGGSLATRQFPTCVVVAQIPGCPAATVATGLRQRDVPIICRVRDDALVFDPRTLETEDAEQIPGAVAEVLRELEAV